MLNFWSICMAFCRLSLDCRSRISGRQNDSRITWHRRWGSFHKETWQKCWVIDATFVLKMRSSATTSCTWIYVFNKFSAHPNARYGREREAKANSLIGFSPIKLSIISNMSRTCQNPRFPIDLPVIVTTVLFCHAACNGESVISKLSLASRERCSSLTCD